MNFIYTGNQATIEFNAFDIAQYSAFIKVKALPERHIAFDPKTETYKVTTSARFARGIDAKAPEVAEAKPLAGHLYDYQAYFTAKALEAERYSHYWDCGLGKTAAGLEFATQVLDRTKAAVLILGPKQVLPEWRNDFKTFYGEKLRTLAGEGELADFLSNPEGLAISNVELLKEGMDFRKLGGQVLDESSLLKTGGGKRKWALIKGDRGVQYKLSLTATPAPNDPMEYASQASWLEKMRSEGEIIWTYFTKDKNGSWYIKPHARKDFYRFMSSWSAYLREPSRYGFKDGPPPLPEPEVFEYKIDSTKEQHEAMLELYAEYGAGLFGDERMGIVPRGKLAQMAKGFLYDRKKNPVPFPSLKPQMVADIARSEVQAGRPTIIWTTYNAEADILQTLCGPRSAVLDGRTDDDERETILAKSRNGDIDIVISNSQSLGFGRNLQWFKAIVGSGFDDSFERTYQCVRRVHRKGQTDRVRLHLPYVADCEGLMFDNREAKAKRYDDDCAEMEECYAEAMGLRCA